MVNVEKAAAGLRIKGKEKESVVETVLQEEMRVAKASKADSLVWIDGAAAGSLLASVIGLLSKYHLLFLLQEQVLTPDYSCHRQISNTSLPAYLSVWSHPRNGRRWSSNSAGTDRSSTGRKGSKFFSDRSPTRRRFR
jgi:hypothetical protein